MALFASTKRSVIDNAAVGIRSTSSGTRIDAFVVDAVLIPRAVRVEDALWST